VNDRSAIGKYLFPVVVVAALIWLAVNTLGGDDSNGDFLFSQALTLVRQGGTGIDHVTFQPSSQKVVFHLSRGETRTTAYPVDESAYELQQLLESRHIPFGATSTRTSAWWSILTSLLPFVLLFGFWIFLMRNVRRGEPGVPGSPSPGRSP
jgi:ATP-dependent Zn protease